MFGPYPAYRLPTGRPIYTVYTDYSLISTDLGIRQLPDEQRQQRAAHAYTHEHRQTDRQIQIDKHTDAIRPRNLRSRP